MTPEQAIRYYKLAYKAALEVLEECGWYQFGAHANNNPCPELIFSSQLDEDGDPFFEKVVPNYESSFSPKERTQIDWELIRSGCPNCGAQRGGSKGLQFHSLSVWCLNCGWGKNWVDE